MVVAGAYEKRLFLVAALWNWGATLLFLSLSILNKDLLTYFYKIPETMLWFYLFGGLVFVFGIGYYWVSVDVWRNRDIIKMGIVGKTIVFLLFLVYLLKGDISVLLFLAGCVDLLFVGLFSRVLIRMTKRQQSPGLT